MKAAKYKIKKQKKTPFIPHDRKPNPNRLKQKRGFVSRMTELSGQGWPQTGLDARAPHCYHHLSWQEPSATLDTKERGETKTYVSPALAELESHLHISQLLCPWQTSLIDPCILYTALG